MNLKVHDTRRGEKIPFETLQPGKVRMYVCGVTPYDRSHIGHARCYVAFDAIYRYLRYLGLEVRYVRNFTDVDDKLIARANEAGVAVSALAEENIAAFYGDMDALGVARPDVEPRVSTSIDDIIALVERLVERGLGYEVEGSVYYRVRGFAGYGKLSGRSLDDMQAGARVDIDGRKEDPMDFALWKAAKPGEPSWESPWGQGRPGWHIECSAMSMTNLGDTIDLHGGGRDLVFPHHENEIAQSEGATGTEFVRFWLHNGFVNIDNEKMSKSLGNFFTIPEIIERYEPMVLRLFLMSTHYRSPINFSDAQLDEAASRMGYFYETLRKVEVLLGKDIEPYEGPTPADALVEGLEGAFRAAMDDDFNTCRALGVLSDAFKTLNELASTRKLKRLPPAAAGVRKLRKVLRRLDAVLNLFGLEPGGYLLRHRAKAAGRRGLSLEWIAEWVQARIDARQAKDWGAADAVRDELQAQGVVLMDTPTGTDWLIEDSRQPAPYDC